MADDLHGVWEQSEFRQRRTIDLLCREFEDAWHSTHRLSIESFAERISATSWAALLSELIACEWELRERSGDPPSVADYAERFPEQQQFLTRLASGLLPRAEDERAPEANSAPPRELQPGDEFAGFQILRRLGSGGMGTVYQAVIPAVGHIVALKILDVAPRHFRSVAVRFEQEARLLSRLNDPGIVPLYSYGESDGLRYLVMKFISGVSLADVLQTQKFITPDSEPTPQSFHSRPASTQNEFAPNSSLMALVRLIRTPDAAGRNELLLDLAQQLANELDVVHKAGILHRDIKPSNILLTPEGKVVLTDFGLARDEHRAADLTQGGEFLGTPRYAAPETLDGDFTRQSDLHSLGLVLFELFSLKTPFAAAGLRELLKAKLSGSIPEMSSVPWAPRDIERVIRGLLHSSAEKRTQTAEILVNQLSQCRAATRTRSRGTRRSSGILITAMLVLLLAGLSVITVRRNDPVSDSASSESSAQQSSQDPTGPESPVSGFALFGDMQLQQKFQLPGKSIPQHLAISNDGSMMLIASRDQQVFLRDAILDELKLTSTSNERIIESIGMSNDGKYGFLVLRDAAPQSRNLFYVESWSIRDLSWTLVPDSPFESTGASLVFIDGFPSQLPPMLLVPNQAGLTSGPAAWTPDTHGYPQYEFLGENRTALAAYFFSTAAATADGKIELLECLIDNPTADPEPRVFETGIKDVFELRFSPDGRHLIAIGSEQLSIVDRQNQTVKVLPAIITSQPALSFAADGRMAAIWSQTGFVGIDLLEAKYLGNKITSTNLVHAAAVSGGRSIITAEASGRICLFDCSGGHPQSIFDSRGPRILAAAYSDTAHLLVVGTIDGCIESLRLLDTPITP